MSEYIDIIVNSCSDDVTVNTSGSTVVDILVTKYDEDVTINVTPSLVEVNIIKANITGSVSSVGLSMPSGFTVTNSPITSSGVIEVTGAGDTSQYIRGDGSLATYNGGTVTSVGLSVPSAFTVSNSPITSSGTIDITGSGNVNQYVRGDGSLGAYNPSISGGGSSQSFYFNGGVASSVTGYKQMSKTANTGASTDFNISADGYIASFLTDAASPNQLNIPAGNWNFEIFFNSSSSGGSPSFYVELYKYNGTTFTLISSSSANPEFITNGTAVDLYTTALSVPETALLITDRLAIRVYVTHSSKTITMHTQSNNLSSVRTTFSSGITALNGLTTQVQNFAIGTSGSDFNISSSTDIHTFNLPSASASNRGVLTSANWSTFNGKESALTFTSPLSRSTNTISIPVSTASVNGYLSSTDWNTFNNKTPLSNLSGTTGYIQKSTGTGTIGNSNIFEDTNKIIYGQFSLSSVTLGIPTITQQQITFRGTPDSIGYHHANIIAKRNTAVNYGTDLRFYTESKSSGTSDDSRDVGGFYYNGDFDVLGKATIQGGTVSFPLLPGGTYLGYQAGNSSIPNSTYNTFIGYQVGKTTTSGYNNTGIGLQTLSAITSGYANTGIGLQTLLAATTAQFNFAGSIHALYSLVDGIANNAIGAGSLEYSIHGTGNNALGMYAGRSYLGNGSLFLGHQAGGLDTSSLDNQLYIANNETTPLIYGIFSPNPYVKIVGAFQTDGLDIYNSDLSASFTNRTKIDKGYAVATFEPIISGTGLVKKSGTTTSFITDNSTNWNTAYTERNQWDGGATGLVAATGRTSLGLGTAALSNASDFQTALGYTPNSGAGTSGYVTQYTGTNTQAISPIYNNAGQVGIGTTSPSSLFHIKGAGSYDGTVIIGNGNTTGGGAIQLQTNGVTKALFAPMGYLLGNTNTDLAVYSGAGSGINFLVNGSTTASLAISSAGVVTTTTQAANDNSTKVATTAYVDAKITSGTWTPASSTVTLTVNFTYYQTVGKMTTAFFYIIFPISTSGSQVEITGLPGTPYNYYPLGVSVNTSSVALAGESATTNSAILLTNSTTHTSVTYAQMSGASLSGSITYRIP